MKASILAVTAIAQAVSAHYSWDVLIVDGQESASLQYFRENTRPAKYNPIKWVNTRDNTTPDGNEIRCNLGADTGSAKETAEIAAGSKVGAKLAVGATMQHPGPASAYLQATDSAATSQGDGEWFKIWETGVCDSSADFTSTAWCTWDQATIEFEIPAATPDGEYLLRVEHIGIHGAAGGEAEFFPACAQIKITGGGSGTVDAETIVFPGGYKQDDESFNFSIYGGYKPYPMPGPAVWGGTTGSGSGSGSNNTSSSSSSSSSGTASSVSSIPTVENASADSEIPSSCGSKKLARDRRAFRESLH